MAAAGPVVSIHVVSVVVAVVFEQYPVKREAIKLKKKSNSTLPHLVYQSPFHHSRLNTMNHVIIAGKICVLVYIRLFQMKLS